MTKEAIIRELDTAMHRTLESLTTEFRGIRTGQANTALVEHAKVSYYGTMTPLNQLANIAVPEPRMIVIKPFDPKCLAEIEKAIVALDMGAAPNNDGKVIRLTIPPLNEENRKQLAGKVKELAEHTRVILRNTRRDTNKQVDKSQKEKTISEDIAHDLKEEVQKEIKVFEKKVDELVERKTKEIMEI